MRVCKCICRKKLVYTRRPRLDLRGVQPQAALVALTKSGMLPRIGGVEALLRKLTGHLPAAVLAKHILGWKRTEVYRTARQLEDSLGLTADEIKAAKRILPLIGIDCVVGRTRYGRATYYRVDIRRLLGAVLRAFRTGVLRLLAAVGVRGAVPDRLGERVTDGSVENPPTIKHQINSLKQKQHEDDDFSINPEFREPLGEGREPLEQIGVNDTRLFQSDPGQVNAWIKYVESRVDIRKKAAYVAQALRQGWQVPVNSIPRANTFADPTRNPFAGMSWSDFAEPVG